jgi:restriction system protein
MSDQSLFAYLLRSPWWVSFAIALCFALVARFLLPDAYAPYAWSLAIPLVIVGGIAASKQWKLPSAARIEATLEAVSAMSWRDFSVLMEQAFQRDGYEVTRMSGAADFKLIKAGRISLVSCKRWKAANHGLEPLRELYAARDAQEAREAIYVAAGNLTDNARRYAVDHKIVLMQGPELATLLRLPRRKRKATD